MSSEPPCSDDWSEVLPLELSDMQLLEKQRQWLKGHFTHDADSKYATVEGKLRLVQAILDKGWIAVKGSHKYSSLGVGLGVALAQELGLDWIVHRDGNGDTISLKWPEKELFTHPLTMISNRIEDGDEVDVQWLFDSLRARLTELASSARSI